MFKSSLYDDNMAEIIHGSLIAPSTGKTERIAIIVARFNEFYTKALLDGALGSLNQLGVKSENVDIYWVPGAFEIPQLAHKLVSVNKYAGIIAIGVLIRGATSHFEYISSNATSGIAQAAYQGNIPVMNAILTVENLDQATERCGTKAGNKGSEAAMGLMEMLGIYRQIGQS